MPSEDTPPALEDIMPSWVERLERMPLLGNLNALEVWPCLNVVMIGWALLVLAPRWRWTKFITVLPPLFHAYVYAGGIISMVFFSKNPDPESPDFSTLQGVIQMFQNPNAMFVGWVHYIVFDLLVGRMIVFDSIERGASLTFHYLVMVPCLALTLMLGPTGWLLYMGIRQVFLPEKQPMPEKTKSIKRV
jgi:hypothetical protein